MTTFNRQATVVSRADLIALYTRLLEAWNRRDAEAFAELFTATASVVGFDGSQMDGRTAIASELGAIFAHHPTAAYVAKVRDVRYLDSDIALVRAVVGMVPPGKSELNPAVNAIQNLVVVPDSGLPRIALLQTTPAAFHGRPHLVEALTAELTAVFRAGHLVDGG